MKKIYLAASILFMAATTTHAQQNNDRNEASGLNSVIKNQFASDFPDASNVQYANGKSLIEVSFTQDKEKIIAYYDNENQLAGSSEKKAFDDLPAKARRTILKNYPGYTIGDVIKFHDNDSDETQTILYGRPLYDADNYFAELKNDSKAIILKVSLSGGVDMVTTLK
jgi:hypothetical protein